MGCGSSAADRAIGFDGHENVEEYVIEINKQNFIEAYILEVYRNTSNNIKLLKQKKIDQINQHQNKAIKFVSEVKTQIEKQEPGSIAHAQALHKTSAEQLLGLSETIQKLQQQKSIVNYCFQKQQQKIIKQIRLQYGKIHLSINPSTAKLQNINALPEADRLKAFKWGDQYAQKEIQLQKNKLKSQMDTKFNFSNFQNRFDNIASTKTLQDILEQGKQRATRATVNNNGCATC